MDQMRRFCAQCTSHLVYLCRSIIERQVCSVRLLFLCAMCVSNIHTAHIWSIFVRCIVLVLCTTCMMRVVDEVVLVNVGQVR